MGSESKRASLSALDGLVDEPDMFPTGAHADFVERFRAFENLYKILWIGKPIGYDGESWIWKQHQAADVIYHYEVRCPACGAYQVMQFVNIKVPEGVARSGGDSADQGRVLRVRAIASGNWTDQIRNRAVRHGRWMPDREGGPSTTRSGRTFLRGILVWVSMSTVMAACVRGAGRPGKTQVVGGTDFAAQPADVVASESSEDRLKQLMVPELPPQVVPDQAQALTFSVDMQKDHFYHSTCAHWVDTTTDEARAEDWIIDQGRVGSFQELSELIYGSRYRRDGTTDQFLGIWRAALDTGGGKNIWEDESRTMQAYQWLLRQRPGVVFGSKGMSRKDPGIHVKFKVLQKFPNGKAMKRGLRLYFIDTDAFKDLLFWRLGEESVDESGKALEPIHFHAKTPDEYFYQVCSEKKVLEKGKYVWKCVRANHWLDCFVGHLAMTHWQWGPSLKGLVAADLAAKQAATVTKTPTAGGARKINPYTGKEM